MFNSLELIKVRLVGLNEPSTIKAIAQTVINSIEEHKILLKELGKPIAGDSLDIKEIYKIIKNQIYNVASFRNPYELFGISSYRIIEEYRKPRYKEILNPIKNEINNSSYPFQDFHYWFIMELNGILIGTLKCHLKYFNINTLKKNNSENNSSLIDIGNTIYDHSEMENKFRLHNDEIYITDLYIHPNFRGAGFSKYLLNTVLNFIKIEVLRLLEIGTSISIISEVLENNISSQKIFNSLKFQPVSNENQIIKYKLTLFDKDAIGETSFAEFYRSKENEIFDLKYQSLKSIRKKRYKMEAHLSQINAGTNIVM